MVVAQAARIVEPDVRELRAAVADLEQLVDLFLVLGDREGDVGIADRHDELGRGRILVERNRHGADRLRREHRGVEARPVLADDDQMLAACQPGFRESARERFDQLGEAAPRVRLPDAQVLLAQSRGGRPAGGVVEQQAGEGGVQAELPPSSTPCRRTNDHSSL